MAWYHHNTETIVSPHWERRRRRRRRMWVDEINECGEEGKGVLKAVGG